MKSRDDLCQVGTSSDKQWHAVTRSTSSDKSDKQWQLVISREKKWQAVKAVKGCDK